jgi:flagellin
VKISLNTNTVALEAQRNLARSREAMAQAMERLASGRRVNGAGDDAAGLGVATRLGAQARSYSMAERNANDGISMLQSADAATSGQADLLMRVRELAVQSGNGTLGAAERGAIQKESAQLLSEVDRIAKTASYNGTPLLDGGGVSISMQVGTNGGAADSLDVKLASTTAQALGVAGADLGSAAGARQALSSIDAALESLGSARAGLGATQNRFASALDTAGAARLSTVAAESRIMDADVASELSALVGGQVRSKAGIAVLSQANKLPGAALSLLR